MHWNKIKLPQHTSKGIAFISCQPWIKSVPFFLYFVRIRQKQKKIVSLANTLDLLVWFWLYLSFKNKLERASYYFFSKPLRLSFFFFFFWHSECSDDYYGILHNAHMIKDNNSQWFYSHRHAFRISILAQCFGCTAYPK